MPREFYTEKDIEDLVRGGSVGPGAVVAWEHAAGADPEWPAAFEAHAAKRYGSTGVGIASYRPTKDDA